MKTGDAALDTPRHRLLDFLALTKPRLNSLVVVTAGVGYLAARSGPLDPVLLTHTAIGSALVAGGAAALNQAAEIDLDERMTRTRSRPLPARRLQAAEAVWFAVAVALVGLTQLATLVNPTAAVVAMATLFSYVVSYTPLKRRSHWALLVGAIPGALPVVIGWVAVAPLTAQAWALFWVVFVWQLPHFLALTWLYREDFERSGLPLLAVVDPSGVHLTRHLMVYSILLIPASLGPAWTGLAGGTYAVGVVVMDMLLLALALRFAEGPTVERARDLFRATLGYLPLAWGLLLLDSLW